MFKQCHWLNEPRDWHLNADVLNVTTDMTTDVAKAAGAKSFHVVLVWGHLPQAHDADDADPDPKVENWSGSVSVDAGAIGLERTIAFDANDHIDPRTSKTSLSFDSHTLPYVDGLLLRAVVPAGGSTTVTDSRSAIVAAHTEDKREAN